jgi:murein DD-endopeptidase MepM/ murein hydrolase activator NlpD
MSVERSTLRLRAVMLAAVLSVASLLIVVVPAGPALADDSATTTTTTTTPPSDSTTTTAPADTTTTTAPADTTTTTAPADTTTTTAPAPDPTTIPPDPAAASQDLSPSEALVPQPAYAALSGDQRALVQQLQTANDTLATRRFALFGLDRQVATAKENLKAARVHENEAISREFLGLVKAALPPDDATTQALSVPGTAIARRPVRAVKRGRSAAAVIDARVTVLDELTRRFESERKSAERERVQAQAAVVALSPSLAAQTQSVTDATTARDAAQSAVERALGADAVRAQADGITATLATAQAGQPDPTVLDGMAMPTDAPLGSPYGMRIDPLTGGGGFHPGLDFDAAYGTQIHAAAAGVVLMAGDCGGYGYCVVIDHGSSVATLYGHQSQLLVQVGDRVVTGQVIGLVGSTGASTGPHLHFEVRVHGLPIDPVPTLTA